MGELHIQSFQPLLPPPPMLVFYSGRRILHSRGFLKTMNVFVGLSGLLKSLQGWVCKSPSSDTARGLPAPGSAALLPALTPALPPGTHRSVLKQDMVVSLLSNLLCQVPRQGHPPSTTTPPKSAQQACGVPLVSPAPRAQLCPGHAKAGGQRASCVSCRPP